MRTLLVILALLVLVGCTVIAFNQGSVTTLQKDSHEAQGTNAHTFDVNISPR